MNVANPPVHREASPEADERWLPSSELQSAILQDEDAQTMAIGSARLDRHGEIWRGKFWVRKWEPQGFRPPPSPAGPMTLLFGDGNSISVAHWIASGAGVSRHFEFSWR